MLRPKREKKSGNMAQKFVRIFSLLMTLLYVGLGLFLVTIDKEKLNLNISNEVRFVLGGILILYGVARFVRVYQLNKKSKTNRNED
jgi:prolipoprotein diacylglyceryltransferase